MKDGMSQQMAIHLYSLVMMVKMINNMLNVCESRRKTVSQ
jgi:hypothetical protein